MPDEAALLKLIANRRHGVLAAVTKAGYPHLTNVLYAWDGAERLARVSTTADRVKGRILTRDPRAALYVVGDHHWAYAVAECDAELSAVASEPGDAACRELLEVHNAVGGGQEDEEAFFARMVEARRLVVRLRVRRAYGLVLDRPPGD